MSVQAILDATFFVLAECGDRMNRSRVANAAGVSLRTLSVYFPSRGALLESAFVEYISILVRVLEAATIEAHAYGLPALAATEYVARAVFTAAAERVAIAYPLSHVLHRHYIDDRPLILAAARRAQAAIVGVLAGGEPPSPALVQRAQRRYIEIRDVVRWLFDNPENLRDPAWIERSIQIVVRRIVPHRPDA